MKKYKVYSPPEIVVRKSLIRTSILAGSNIVKGSDFPIESGVRMRTISSSND